MFLRCLCSRCFPTGSGSLRAEGSGIVQKVVEAFAACTIWEGVGTPVSREPGGLLPESALSAGSRCSRRVGRQWSVQWPSTSKTGTNWFCATPTSRVYKLDRSRNTPTFPWRQVSALYPQLGMRSLNPAQPH